MVFSSFLFLFGFLPVFLACYFLAPRSFKNLVALLASYCFYSWGAPTLVFILLISSLADYLIVRSMPGRSELARKRLVALALVINLSFLFYYKYTNFFLHEVNRAFLWLELTPITWSKILLPIGISFFTFQKISYVVDSYRGVAKPARNFLDYALYVALFPQLIAGPIIRYHDIAQQIRSRSHTIDDFFYGMYRFCIGLAKKVLIADIVGAVADNVFSMSASELTFSYAWLGILCYAFQIYFDFSGYSDMAIGLGRMMGFRFLENFNMPYISQSITEFWRRWHISLSNWMKEYLYIPLGGNRVSTGRMYMNLWIVFLLSGLWHGAQWTFVAWGIFHGLFLVIDKLFWLKITKKLPKLINVAVTFLIVLCSWVFFRSDTIQEAFQYLNVMFDFSSITVAHPSRLPASVIHTRGTVTLFIAIILSFLPVRSFIEERVRAFHATYKENSLLLSRAGLALSSFILAVLALSASSFNPFLYFKF